MTIRLPIEALYIVAALQRSGFSVYLVGGAVRDMLQSELLNLDVTATDFDFTTNATPDQIMQTFPEAYYENEFGTVSITQQHLREQVGLSPIDTAIEGSASVSASIDVNAVSKLHPSLTPIHTNTHIKHSHSVFEITTFRSDGAYSDHRRPESVTWGQTLEEDLERRDFTINAMAIEIAPEFVSASLATDVHTNTVIIEQPHFSIIDPHQGLQDLQWRVIKTVNDPSRRFQEDALRMLRAVRFAVQLGFSIDQGTYQAIHTHADLLKHISGERIRDEFFKMLCSDRPKQAIETLDDSGLLTYILPELQKAKGVSQSGHHTTDVWTHSLDALEASPSKDPVVKLATLVHDIAKPDTFRRTETGAITFYNHEVVGARQAKAIAERLKLSKKDIDRVFVLVRFHMFHYQPEQTDAAIRRFMRKVGLENLNDILDVREADRLGSGARKTSWRLEEMKKRMIDQLNQPFDVTDLALNGHDLMQELDLPPGPMIGQLLSVLLEEVLENPEKNTKEELLATARELAKELASSLSKE